MSSTSSMFYKFFRRGVTVFIGFIIFFLGCNFLFTNDAYASVSFVQSASSANSGSTYITSQAVSFTNNTQAGNMIVATVSCYSDATYTVPTDTQGNTYQSASGPITNGETIQIFYALNIQAAADTVTSHMSSSRWCVTNIHEYSGIATTGALDQYATASGTTATSNALITAGPVTTMKDGELIFSMFSANTGPYTVGSGFTMRESASDATEDKIQTTAGSISATAYDGQTGDPWQMLLATFKPASGAGNVPTINTFSASPSSVTVGSSPTLSWDVSNATSITVTGNNLNYSTSTNFTGNTSVTPNTTGALVYTLTATNSNGTTTATTSITVNSASTGTTPSYVTGSWKSGDGGSSSTEAIYADIPVAGDTLVVCSHWDPQTVTATVTDSYGDVYQPIGSGPVNFGSVERGECWYSYNVSTGGPYNKITITYSAQTTTFSLLDSFEFTGITSTTSPLDVFQNATGFGNILNSGSTGMTKNSNELAIGFFLTDGYASPFIAGDGFTDINYDASSFLEDMTTSAITTVTATATDNNNSENWLGYVFTLNSTGGSSPTINTFSASPSSVTVGSSPTLSWDVSNATSITVTGNNLNYSTSTNFTGNTSVTPNTTGALVYTLTATNSNGTTTATTSITVNSASTESGCDGSGNCYIYAGATGAGNGSSWTNAYTGFGTGTNKVDPTKMKRGVVYWIANGSYGSQIFSTPVDGTKIITIKGVTTTSHGPATDWNNTYAGQAVFGESAVSSDYWTFDGQTRGTDWQSGYTIKFDLNGIDIQNGVINTGGAEGSGDGASNVTFKYIEVRGSNMNYSYNSHDSTNCIHYCDAGFETDSPTNNFYVGYSWIHDVGGVQFQSNDNAVNNTNGSNWMIEYNYISRNRTGDQTSGNHSEAFSATVQNMTVRYNYFQDIGSTGVITDASAGTPNVGPWYIYGNINFWTDNTGYPGVGDGFVVFLGETMHGTSYIVNNTIANIENTACDSENGVCNLDLVYAIGGDGGTPTIYVENNLLWNVANGNCFIPTTGWTFVGDYNTAYESSGWNNCGSHAQNIASGNPFTNWDGSGTQIVPYENLNFQIKADTSPGIALSSSLPTGCVAGVNCLNVAFNGIAYAANGIWDRGALQISGTASPSVSLSPSSVTFSNQLINTTSSSQSITLTNIGSATLNISGIAISGTNASNFSQTNNCASTLSSSSSCTITVSFTPSAIGSRTANLTITDNAADSPESVTLSGTSITTYTIGGTISGLTGTVVLQDNSSDNLSKSANGSFTFATAIATGGTYSVSVLTQPSGQTCTVANSSGTVATANITNANVTCTTNATVPGAPTSVSAVSGNAQATVSFTVPVSNGGATITGYTVTSSPSGLTATGSASPVTVTGLTNGTAYTFTVTATNSVGTGSASSASNSVTPNATATTYTFSGPSSGTVNTASTSFTVTPNATYTGTITITPSGGGLSTPIVLTFSSSATAKTFTITPTSTGTVTLTPTNSTSLTNPSALSYVANAVATYTIGGTISGLTGTVVLQDNSSDNLSKSANGSFTFATAIATGGTYSVSVLTQPSGQTCTVANGNGTISGVNVANISVSCTTPVVYSGGGGGGYSTVSTLSNTTNGVIAGCTTTAGFSTITGQSCANNTISTNTFAGCDNRITGFSTTTGHSCIGNTGGGVTTTTVPTANFKFTQGLKLGSSGNEVVQLQKLLNSYFNLNLKVDGILGQKSVFALMRLQLIKKMKVDGIIGPATRVMLNTLMQQQ